MHTEYEMRVMFYVFIIKFEIKKLNYKRTFLLKQQNKKIRAYSSNNTTVILIFCDT